MHNYIAHIVVHSLMFCAGNKANTSLYLLYLAQNTVDFVQSVTVLASSAHTVLSFTLPQKGNHSSFNTCIQYKYI